MCRPCRAAYKQRHFVANRQRYIDQARLRKQSLRLERTAYLIDFFESNPCSDCAVRARAWETDPLVLEFDHLGDKSFNIGGAIAYRNWESILAEIEKCEVVCTNCHRRRTAHRRSSVRALLMRPSELDG